MDRRSLLKAAALTPLLSLFRSMGPMEEVVLATPADLEVVKAAVPAPAPTSPVVAAGPLRFEVRVVRDGQILGEWHTSPFAGLDTRLSEAETVRFSNKDYRLQGFKFSPSFSTLRSYRSSFGSPIIYRP